MDFVPKSTGHKYTNHMTIKEKIKEIKKRRSGLRLSSKTIQSKTRSIRATWTREMAFEIDSYHGIDMTQGLEEFLLRELNSQGPSN
jgi:hypothetical protein